MTANQHPSVLATLATYALVGGVAVAGVSFGSGALSGVIGNAAEKMDAGTWQNVAASVGSGLASISGGIETAGDAIINNTPLKDASFMKNLDETINGRLVASIATAIGLGGMASMLNIASSSSAPMPSGPGTSTTR